MIAVLAGVSVVTQTQLWLKNLGQSGMLGSILVTVIVREIAPLLVNFVVIGRSGTAIATEMASMRVRGEWMSWRRRDWTRWFTCHAADTGVRVLRFRPDDSLHHGLPRERISVRVAGGRHVGRHQSFRIRGPGIDFPRDVANLLAKTLVSGVLVGSVCCLEGLTVQGAVTEVPQAATRGVVGAILAVLIVSAVVSVLMYA